MNISAVSPTTKKAIAIGTTSAALGAIASYTVQKQAIKNFNSLSNAKGISKTILVLKSIPKKIICKTINLYLNYKTNLNKIAASGKISKPSIAKTSTITGLTFTALYLLKRLYHSQKNKSN